MDALVAAVSDGLRHALGDGDPTAWYPAAHHSELLAGIESNQVGAARRVSDRAIARGLRGEGGRLLPKLSPSCVAERLHAIVAEHADWIRLELSDRTLVSARWRAVVSPGAGARGEVWRDWVLGSARGALMAAGSPEATAELEVRDGIGELRVEWA
jgi:hypothetical protein